MKIKHVSYSAVKDWMTCPHKFKVVWVDRSTKFCGNSHTVFGSAVHSVLEYQIQGKKPENFTTWDDFFEQEFIRFISQALKNGAPKSDFDKKLISSMREQGKELISLALPALKKKFGKFSVIKTELQLMEPITEFDKTDCDFKGFIDLVIGTEDGRVHVLDWKSSTGGWFRRESSDKKIIYQLVFYKHYLAKKLEIDPKEIDVHFALLKRTPKKNKVEFVDITSGPKRTKNALKVLEQVLSSCRKEYYPKNRLACERCDLNHTKWCVR